MGMHRSVFLPRALVLSFPGALHLLPNLPKTPKHKAYASAASNSKNIDMVAYSLRAKLGTQNITGPLQTWVAKLLTAVVQHQLSESK